MKEIDIVELEERYRTISNIGEYLELDKKYWSYLEERLAQNPQDIQALIDLGVLSWEPFHEEQQAIEYLEKAIEYDPQNVDARFWLAKCVYHDLCDDNKAKNLLLEALEIDPDRPDCLDFLTEFLEDTAEGRKVAINNMEKAIKIASDWPALRFSLASLYLKNAQIAEAEQQIQKMEELANTLYPNPKNAIEYYYEYIVTGRNNNKLMLEDARIMKEKIHRAKMLSGKSNLPKRHKFDEFLKRTAQISNEQYPENIWICAETPPSGDVRDAIAGFFACADQILEKPQEFGLTDAQCAAIANLYNKLKEFTRAVTEQLPEKPEWQMIQALARRVIGIINHPEFFG